MALKRSIPVRLKWQIKRFSNFHIQGQQPNIFIFSTARSGTTWLMEIIATQPTIKIIDEPLSIKNIKRFESTFGPLPYSWDILLPHPGREEVIERYFDDLTHNRISVGSRRPFSHFHRILSRRIVFNIQRCKDLMNWFEERFAAKIVYLIRHPLPTSISRAEFERTPLFLTNDLYCERYLSPEQRAYGREILKFGTDLEKKVLDWCLQNLPPLKFLDRSHWLCVHYEDLTVDPEATLQRIAQELGLPRLDRMRQQITAPSSSQSDNEMKRHIRQLSLGDDRSYFVRKWRDKVSGEEEMRAFEILDSLDIDTYSIGQDMPANRM